jgi:hypothetical protein
VIEAVVPAPEAVAVAIEPVIGAVTEPVLTVVEAVIEPVAAVIDPVAGPAAAVIESVTEPVATVIMPVAPVVEPVIEPVAAVLEPVALVVEPGVEPIFDAVTPVVEAVAATVAPAAEPVVASVFAPVVEAVVPVAELVAVVHPSADGFLPAGKAPEIAPDIRTDLVKRETDAIPPDLGLVDPAVVDSLMQQLPDSWFDSNGESDRSFSPAFFTVTRTTAASSSGEGPEALPGSEGSIPLSEVGAFDAYLKDLATRLASLFAYFPSFDPAILFGLLDRVNSYRREEPSTPADDRDDVMDHEEWTSSWEVQSDWAVGQVVPADEEVPPEDESLSIEPAGSLDSSWSGIILEELQVVPAVISRAMQSAELLTDLLPVDVAALEITMRQFLDEADIFLEETETDWASLLAVLAVATLAYEVARREMQRPLSAEIPDPNVEDPTVV